MPFMRSFDLSCITNAIEAEMIQHAIDGVNAACTEMVDAWLYVAQGHLIKDNNRQLGTNDHIPRAVFKEMEQDRHSGSTAQHTIETVTAIAEDYESWKVQRQHLNTLKENNESFWNNWRVNVLMPFVKNMSAGGNIDSMGPILEEYFQAKYNYNGYSEVSNQIRDEIMGYLGSNDDARVEILQRITSSGNYPNVHRFYINMKKKIEHEYNEKKYADAQIDTAFNILKAAVQSRNPVAINAALSPGWYSMRFNMSPEFQQAQQLLNDLTI